MAPEVPVILPKRKDGKLRPSIANLINIINTNDIFNLLEDDDILPCNLTNAIHTIFSSFEIHRPLKRALQLASQFLTHDTLASFWVPLLYGETLTTILPNGTKKEYLTNPFDTATQSKRKRLLEGVHSALHCLSHTIDFKWVSWTERIYARTRTYTGPAEIDPLALAHTASTLCKPTHSSACFPGYTYTETILIELNNFFYDYYTEEYPEASTCSQLRHDFLFAIVLCHELAHAVGIMRRGNIIEPYISLSAPETEWGLAWEHFMFGGILNPHDTSGHGTHALMRRAWVNKETEIKAGGREYSAVPMAWIARWFRSETWDVVRDRGPLSVDLGVGGFKIQRCGGDAWRVSSWDKGVRGTITEWLVRVRKVQKEKDDEEGMISKGTRIGWNFVGEDELMVERVVTPSRWGKGQEKYFRVYQSVESKMVEGGGQQGIVDAWLEVTSPAPSQGSQARRKRKCTESDEDMAVESLESKATPEALPKATRKRSRTKDEGENTVKPAEVKTKATSTVSRETSSLHCLRKRPIKIAKQCHSA